MNKEKRFEQITPPTREEIATYLGQGYLPGFEDATVERDITEGKANNHFNWVVVKDDHRYLMRIARPKPDKMADIELEYEMLQYIGEEGIAPRVYAIDLEHFKLPLLIEDFIEGKMLHERFGKEELRSVAETLALLHKLPIPAEIALRDRTYGSRWETLQGRFDTAVQQPLVREHARPLFELLPRIETFFEIAAREADETPRVLLHGDLYCGNIIVTPEGRAVLIDFQYSAIGDPTFDFGNLFVGRNERSHYEKHKDMFLNAYQEHYGVYPELERLFDMRMTERDITSLFSELRDAARMPQNEEGLAAYFKMKGFTERITLVEEELKQFGIWRG